MRIIQVSNDSIKFDNGNIITYDHDQDCCECNYADFNQLDDIARTADFDTDLKFEEVRRAGFRFGDTKNGMFFVPCYSCQNGYYSSDVDIYYNNKSVLTVLAEEVIE